MTRDRIFERTRIPGSFTFDEEVAGVFDDMLERSIPFYREQQAMITRLAERFWIPGTDVYDLGCSTATTLLALQRALPEAARLVGYDSSAAILERGRRKVSAAGLSASIELREGDLGGDLAVLPLRNASVVTLCWTLQFVPSGARDALIRWIHDGLVPGGALIVAEKVVASDARTRPLFIEEYHQMKREHGYSEDEIQHKARALENVLLPNTEDENARLFRRNGFEVVEPFFRWYNFNAVLCVKAAEIQQVDGQSGA